MSLTFMAKPNEREGNSCHIHFSLRGADGGSAMLGDGPAGTVARSGSTSLAGLLATMREFTPAVRAEHQLLQAVPARLVRADRGALGRGQPHLRAAGGRARAGACGWRTGCPAATSTRTWRSPALVAGGAARHRERAAAGGRVRRQRLRRRDGAAGAGDAARGARRCGRASAWPAAAFGDEVVAHYANNARVELAAFDAAVTDWELFRGFERL